MNSDLVVEACKACDFASIRYSHFFSYARVKEFETFD